MIIFQVRVGRFGQGGWRTVPFWSAWLPALLLERVTRVVIGSAASVDELAKDGYHWFDKRVRRDRLHEVPGHKLGLDM